MATVFYENSTGSVRSVTSLDVNPQLPPETSALRITEEEFRKFFDPPPPGKLVKVENGVLVAVDPPKQGPIPPGT